MKVRRRKRESLTEKEKHAHWLAVRAPDSLVAEGCLLQIERQQVVSRTSGFELAR